MVGFIKLCQVCNYLLRPHTQWSESPVNQEDTPGKITTRQQAYIRCLRSALPGNHQEVPHLHPWDADIL